MKEHIKAVVRNFFIAFSGLWTFLESSSGFGWITTTSFGVWGYLYMCLIALLLSFVATYIEFQFKKEKVIIQKQFPEIIDFNGSYKLSQWGSLIANAQEEIILCGYYFDTWIGWVENDMKKFLLKNKTILKVIVSDPSNLEHLKKISRLFPQYSEDLVRNKIRETKTKFLSLITALQLAETKFEFYHYKNLLNYSFILVDKKSLLLTIYENERGEKKDSFSIVIDLEKNDEIKKFILKEYRLMISNSEKK